MRNKVASSGNDTPNSADKQTATDEPKAKDSGPARSTVKKAKTTNKRGFNPPTPISEENKLKIIEDIKAGVSYGNILKKYHINIPALTEIKKSLGNEALSKSKDDSNAEQTKRDGAYIKKDDGEDKALNWFKKKYSGKEFAFAMREYKTNSVIKGGERFKAVEVFPEKVDGLYFIVYKNTPVKEKKYNNDKTYEKRGVYLPA